MPSLSALDLFRGEEHHPFFWESGAPAAVLVHGFPGTPAELRSLGRFLYKAGWTVQGLLLPGFGQQIDSLFTKSKEDWIFEVVEAIETLGVVHSPIVLFGYSLGGAVSIHAAAEATLDKLLLMAPFWRLGTCRDLLIWRFLRRFFRHFQAFRGQILPT